MMSWPLPPEMTSLPSPPASTSLPLSPKSVSFPLPPLMKSLSPLPARKSLPPLPSMLSGSPPPLMLSLPSVPKKVAMSDHPDVWRNDGSRALNGCHELRVRAARTVCVVVELSSGRVVDDAIVCIVACGAARSGEDPGVARREAPIGTQCGERIVVEAQAVPVVAVEVVQHVGIAGAEFAEHVAVLPRAARELVV